MPQEITQISIDKQFRYLINEKNMFKRETINDLNLYVVRILNYDKRG